MIAPRVNVLARLCSQSKIWQRNFTLPFISGVVSNQDTDGYRLAELAKYPVSATALQSQEQCLLYFANMVVLSFIQTK